MNSYSNKTLASDNTNHALHKQNWIFPQHVFYMTQQFSSSLDFGGPLGCF